MVLASEYVEVPTEVTALMYTSMDEISFTDPVYEKMSRSALIPVGKQVWVEGFYPFSLPSRSARKRVFENDTIHPIASGFIAMLVEKARRELLLQSTISNTVKDLKPM